MCVIVLSKNKGELNFERKGGGEGRIVETEREGEAEQI